MRYGRPGWRTAQDGCSGGQPVEQPQLGQQSAVGRLFVRDANVRWVDQLTFCVFSSSLSLFLGAATPELGRR